MSNQLIVAFSSYFKGAGLLCGGQYGMQKYHEQIQAAHSAKEPKRTEEFEKHLKLAIDIAEGFERDGKIDSLKNLKDTPIYIYAGKND